MEDPVLNRCLEETKELHTRWGQFRDFCQMAIKTKKIQPQAEMKFMELKSRIAMLHDGFMQTLEKDQKVGMTIMQVVQDCILLKQVAELNDAERQKFEFDWNECYMLLTEQISHMEEEKERLAGINERVYKARQRKEMVKAKISNFLHSAGMKALYALAFLTVFLYIIPVHVWSYRGFYDIPGMKQVYLPFVNYVFRPIFKEYAHDSLSTIPRVSEPKLPESIVKEDADGVDSKWLREIELPSMVGGKDSKAPEFQQKKQRLEALVALLDTNVKPENLLIERWSADKMDVRFFFIMFDTPASAREFVVLMKEAISALPHEENKIVREGTGLYRSANFVALGRSLHAMCKSFPKERYKVWPVTAQSELDR